MSRFRLYPLPDHLKMPMSVHFINHRFPIRITWKLGRHRWRDRDYRIINIRQSRGWHPAVRIPDTLMRGLSDWTLKLLDAEHSYILQTRPPAMRPAQGGWTIWKIHRGTITVHNDGLCSLNIQWVLHGYAASEYRFLRSALLKKKPKPVRKSKTKVPLESNASEPQP